MTAIPFATTPSPASPAEHVRLGEVTRLAQAGRLDEARAEAEALAQANPGLVEARMLLGAVAFRQGRFEEAEAAYRECVALDPGHLPFRLNLAVTLEKAGELDKAADVYLEAWRTAPATLQLALNAADALEIAGRREEAAALFSLADDLDPRMRAARNDPTATPEARRLAGVADRVMRAFMTELHQRAVDAAEQALKAKDPGAKPDLTRVRAGIWTQTHDGPVEFRTPHQEPSIFYMPDLPARPITPREMLPWASKIEAATAVIRDEYLAAVEGGAQLSPYVGAATEGPQWSELRGNADWSSIHLFKEAMETPFASLFPRTLEALEAADVVRVDNGKAVELFFSRLKPGAHIPPHFGCANNRITVHLPLIVPGDCAIRVGGETHVWREGELFAFDDSFEHEAWNRAESDRVVLIFEAHHPDLTADERFAVEKAFEIRGLWVRNRRALLLGQAQDAAA